MGKPSPPKPPDPTATIAAQSTANQQSAIQTAELNRINQTSPWGSSSYQITGHYPDGTPIYSQTTTLSPQEQQLLNTGLTGAQALGNTGLGMLGTINKTVGTPINTSSLPGIASKVAPTAGAPGITGSINTSGLPSLQSTIGTGDVSSQIRQAQQAAYGAQAQFLDPQFQHAQDELNNQLANEGIAQGSDAWNKAQQQLSLQRQSAYQGAMNEAVSAGNQEQNTLFGQAATQGAFNNAALGQGFGQAQQQAAFGNTANQQAFGQGASNADLQNAANAQALQQIFALRQEPLNEYSALMSGTQVNSPNFSAIPAAGVGNTNVGEITNQAYQNQLGYYNAQLAANPMNALFSLGGSLGSAALMGGF